MFAGIVMTLAWHTQLHWVNCVSGSTESNMRRLALQLIYRNEIFLKHLSINVNQEVAGFLHSFS